MNVAETKAAVDPYGEDLRPVLDGAMHDLGARDHEAILLRYLRSSQPRVAVGGAPEVAGAIRRPDRNALFFAFGAAQVEGALNQFGGVQRTLTITREGAHPGGNQLFKIQDERKTEHGRHSSSRTVVREKLANSLGAFANLLPTDF